MLRFMEGVKYKPKETYELIIKHYKWHTEKFPIEISFIDKYIEVLN